MQKQKRALNRRGIAIFAVLGFIAVTVPVIYLLSRIGSSQMTMARRYQDAMSAEETTFSGHVTGITRLRTGEKSSEFQKFINQVSGDQKFDLTICPTGLGFVAQVFYTVLCKSTITDHSCILTSDAEQLSDTSPVLVIPRNYWNTVADYDITLAMDVLGITNKRGVGLLELEKVMKFEREKSKNAYIAAISGVTGSLPKELVFVWPDVVELLAKDKLDE